MRRFIFFVVVVAALTACAISATPDVGGVADAGTRFDTIYNIDAN